MLKRLDFFAAKLGQYWFCSVYKCMVAPIFNIVTVILNRIMILSNTFRSIKHTAVPSKCKYYNNAFLITIETLRECVCKYKTRYSIDTLKLNQNLI